MDVSLDGAIQVTLAGLATGSVYALLLLGILIVFRVSKAVNFAQGQLGMIAAYVAWALFTAGVIPIWLALLAGIFLAAALGFLTDRVFIERLSRRGTLEGQDLVVTLGVMLLLTAAAGSAFWSPVSRTPRPAGKYFPRLCVFRMCGVRCEV